MAAAVDGNRLGYVQRASNRISVGDSTQGDQARRMCDNQAIFKTTEAMQRLIAEWKRALRTSRRSTSGASISATVGRFAGSA
jgi:hypothetical protein